MRDEALCACSDANSSLEPELVVWKRCAGGRPRLRFLLGSSTTRRVLGPGVGDAPSARTGRLGRMRGDDEQTRQPGISFARRLHDDGRHTAHCAFSEPAALPWRQEYGLADRNQEGPGLRWGDFDFVKHGVVQEDVVSMDGLGEGKTSSAMRLSPLPPTTELMLLDWRDRAAAAGIATGDTDFVVPGASATGYFTNSQAKALGTRQFGPSVELVAMTHPHLRGISGATLYALRRGAISLRLRAGEDETKVSKQCGTSVQMLRLHYQFALDAFEEAGPIDADAERLAAYELVWGTRARRALRVVS